MSDLLRGLIAFPIMPADTAGRIDEPALRGLLRRLLAAEVDGIGLLGSTGTYAYLSRAERRRAVEIAADEIAGRARLLVGIGALRTDEAVALAADARDAGADAGLLAPVSYTPLLDDEVFAHFEAVAAGGWPICIYDNPGTTHFTFRPELVGRLSRLPGIIGLKTAGAADEVAARHAARHASWRDVAPAPFSIGYAADWTVTEGLIAGGEAWYSVMGGLFPAPCVTIVRAVAAGDAAEARRLNAELEPFWTLLRRYTGVRVMFAAARHLGLITTAPPRPILPLVPPAVAEVAAVIERLDLS